MNIASERTKTHLSCAIYTRKSSEEGLEQEFNSLQAQREACEAYIASQKHEGWTLVKTAYDDGGFSGGNMQRPALKALLADIAASKIDVIVVYKVDRLSRSLHDFARMVELFDTHKMSFVSVTQAFNTTSSMGRLTLNVLLSFAQFEREVTGERIRDKIAASKKKGMWMGGSLPLGYDVVERKLVINPAEAIQVQRIFDLYLKHSNVRLLQEDLRREGIVAKARASDQRPGGAVMARGALYKLLANPIYRGQIRHQGVCYPGQHAAIVDAERWDAVQVQLKANTNYHAARHAGRANTNWLIGKLFDAAGERLTPNHCVKQGRRYRYYVSHRLVTETASQHQDGWRLPARGTEQIVVHAAQSMLEDQASLTTVLRERGIDAHRLPGLIQAAKSMAKQIGDAQVHTSATVLRLIQRAELHMGTLRLTLCLDGLTQDRKVESSPSYAPSATITMMRDIPLQIKRRAHEMRLVIEGRTSRTTKSDPVMVKAIARSHVWADALLLGNADSMRTIARGEGVTDSTIKKQMPLAFLAPDIVKAILDGTQPEHLTTYAKPPVATRFQKGQSGNATGRKKGSKNNQPALHEERLKTIMLDEAYRTIQVNDGNCQVTMPMAQAIMRALAVSAAKGQTRAQKLFVEMLSRTEQSNKQVYDEYTTAVLNYKYCAEAEIERCEKLGIEPPELIPHPSQITINGRTGEVIVKGPTTKEEKATYDEFRERKADFKFSVAETKKLLLTEPAELHPAILEAIAYEQSIVDILSQVIPD